MDPQTQAEREAADAKKALELAKLRDQAAPMNPTAATTAAPWGAGQRAPGVPLAPQPQRPAYQPRLDFGSGRPGVSPLSPPPKTMKDYVDIIITP